MEGWQGVVIAIAVASPAILFALLYWLMRKGRS